MYDIHCHILPAIDDGAKDKAEALSLLKLAVAEGITHIVFTPHMHIGRFDNSKVDIYHTFFDFKQLAADHNIKIEMACAAEVRIDADLIYLFSQKKIPFLGQLENKSIVLLELPHSHFPQGTEKLISWMIDKDIVPVIAHPERNRDIQKNNQLAIKLKKLGCYLQLTAGSVCGQFGDSSYKLSEFLLSNNMVDVIASDAHNLKRRPPKLKEAFNYISKKYSASYANDLFINNPKNITSNLFIC
ncbi:tyrosine-protein phosphatase [Pseudoalteromonas piratica]|uniref:protein-tyrosine-phosphatase n=1 Tax=Pseudoalteromonas piratica TaxID=1348114 RepID=A0A0A7EHA2_9GAMM|nr:CpsB/CapC family capsule biosynthesis tyrosine phosphatase [Pseudoalteromonas piratica]AIY65441.1 hypothetical protein OM33_09985 [Pseudoalteromonas piratica]